MKTTDQLEGEKKSKLPIGLTAAKVRTQLQQLKAQELQRQQAAREARAQLEKELAELEVVERRQLKELESEEKRQVCLVLGDLVLKTIAQGSVLEFRFGHGNLTAMKETDREKLNRVLGRVNTDQLRTIPNATSQGSREIQAEATA